MDKAILPQTATTRSIDADLSYQTSYLGNGETHRLKDGFLMGTRAASAISGVLLLITCSIETQPLWKTVYNSYKEEMPFVSRALGSLAVLQINWYLGLVLVSSNVSPLAHWYIATEIMPPVRCPYFRAWLSWMAFGLCLDCPLVYHKYRMLYRIVAVFLLLSSLGASIAWLLTMNDTPLEERLRYTARNVEMEVDHCTHSMERNQVQRAEEILDDKRGHRSLGENGISTLRIDD